MLVPSERLTKASRAWRTGRHARAEKALLGPLLARRKTAAISMPGGCAFGARPIDLHLRGLEALGAKIELKGGDIIAREVLKELNKQFDLTSWRKKSR